MEMAASSAPSTSSHSISLSLAQAVLRLAINAVLIFLTAVIKSSSSSSSSRRREPAPAPAATPAPSHAEPAKPTRPTGAGAIDMDVVLGVMGAGGVSVGFEEAAALFEEEEATVEEARAAFAVFDRDGDGFIDAAELRSVLGSLGLVQAAGGTAVDECQRMIDAYDEDKDGRIGFHEFVKLMETSSS